MAEMNFIDYVAVQGEIRDSINAHLPTITDFPVDYCSVDGLLEQTPSMSMVFMPTGHEYMADMRNYYRQVSFMLQYRGHGSTSDDKLDCMKALEYLAISLKRLNIQLQNDKIVLGLECTLSPSVQSYDETGETCVYSVTFQLNYKQKRV